ncbi:S-protein homolog 2-like [Nicotiana tabacum]|uniref:S-protein homolog 2-like n=1 Tax=Nicotiana tabacum TaxID=4097 RepID=A0AC58UP09_TOBAC
MGCILFKQIFCLFILTFYFTQEINATGREVVTDMKTKSRLIQFGIPPISVHIMDRINATSPQLIFHCASGDDDLGYHYPKFNQDFMFTFGLHFFVETVFFCHFWWGSEDKAFEVFRDSGACADHGGLDTSDCFWIVKSDGFYFTNVDPDSNPSSITKIYDWK